MTLKGRNLFICGSSFCIHYFKNNPYNFYYFFIKIVRFFPHFMQSQICILNSLYVYKSECIDKCYFKKILLYIYKSECIDKCYF